MKRALLLLTLAGCAPAVPAKPPQRPATATEHVRAPASPALPTAPTHVGDVAGILAALDRDSRNKGKVEHVGKVTGRVEQILGGMKHGWTLVLHDIRPGGSVAEIRARVRSVPDAVRVDSVVTVSGRFVPHSHVAGQIECNPATVD